VKNLPFSAIFLAIFHFLTLQIEDFSFANTMIVYFWRELKIIRPKMQRLLFFQNFKKKDGALARPLNVYRFIGIHFSKCFYDFSKSLTSMDHSSPTWLRVCLLIFFFFNWASSHLHHICVILDKNMCYSIFQIFYKIWKYKLLLWPKNINWLPLKLGLIKLKCKRLKINIFYFVRPRFWKNIFFKLKIFWYNLINFSLHCRNSPMNMNTNVGCENSHKNLHMHLKGSFESWDLF
jgi:hypothetical protein